MISSIAAAFVGLVFLFTGALKAVDARGFFKQVHRYRLLPVSWEQPIGILFIGLECALGIALVVGITPWLILVAAAVLIGFAALTAWGTSSGRVEDCGCYGGLLLLTPAQSLALDALYLALLAVAWFTLPDTAAVMAVGWKLGAVAIVLLAAVAAAVKSLRKPLVDIALLQVGRRWRRTWLRGTTVI